MDTGEGRETLSAGLQADLQRREAQLRDRQQQTGEAHRSLLSRATMHQSLKVYFHH